MDTPSWKDLPVVLVAGTASWKDLPSCLVTDILSRLPVKTLVQSTCVNKSWYALITDPSFISTHIARSISDAHKNSNHYLLISPISLSPQNPCSIISEKTCAEASKIEIPFRTRSQTVLIAGSCNGLLCLTDECPFHFGTDVYLWNPTLKKHKLLGPSCFPNQLHDRIRMGTAPVLGFGFHEPSNDYRVVRVVYCWDEDYNYLGRVAPKVEVYSLRKDSWRVVKNAVVPKVGNHRLWVCVKGSIYWMKTEKKRGPYESIVSFDLSNEVFNEVKLPKHFRDEVGQEAIFTVLEYKGLLSVCVFDISKDYGGQHLSLWVMKGGVPAVSWTRQYKIILKEGVGWPVKFSCSGKAVMETVDRVPKPTSLISCDLDTRKFMNLASDGPYTVDAAFMESLLVLSKMRAVASDFSLPFKTATILSHGR
ncbi:hypothetical protein RJ639_036877 [Escallonia herrerae]|uniref:F-box domain-containing protein n=1 Tax=Escallonia herrerae TaxID=1293975 RepID=A0AA88WPR8_9ASTE|nr:hypothetical protein RJ639_036877 [Escallonia herrerae]